MPSAVSLREDYSAEELRGLACRSVDGFCRWLRSGMGWIGAPRRRSAAWTGRRCATGFIASTPRAQQVSRSALSIAP